MNDVPVKRLVRNLVQKSDDSASRYLGLEHVESGTGKLNVNELPTNEAGDSVAHSTGDVLFNKLRPYLSKSYLAHESGVGSSELLVLRPTDRMDSRFLLYLTLSTPWIEWANATSYGTKMPRTSWESLAAYRAWAPPIEEQQRIADFLDAETARIDQLANARRRQVELLEERVDAQWRSTIEAAGERCGWTSLRRFIEAITDGPFGSSLRSSHYSDSGARVIRLGNVGRASFRDDDEAYIPMEYYAQLRRHDAQPGDLIVAGLGDENNPLGRACVVPNGVDPAIVKADCYRIRLDQKRMLHEFVAWALSSPTVSEHISLLARGSTRARINLGIVREISVPTPSLSEQHRISAQLQARRDELLTTSDRCNRQLDLLAERRQALITAAVTGQLEETTGHGVEAP